jgi:hypothetical protein
LIKKILDGLIEVKFSDAKEMTEKLAKEEKGFLPVIPLVLMCMLHKN